MSDDLMWAIAILLGIMGIILSFFGGYTLVEITEEPYEKCIDSCTFFISGDDKLEEEMEFNCIKDCKSIIKCEANQ